MRQWLRSHPTYAMVTSSLALFIALAAGVLLGSAATASAALVADYRFKDTRGSSVGTAPALTDIGPVLNKFANETVDGATRRVLTFPKGNGLRLSPPPWPTSQDKCGPYTIVVLARFQAITDYRRVIDTLNGGFDQGIYLHGGRLEFFPYSNPGPNAVAAGSYFQVALTHGPSSLRTTTGYLNGVQQWSVQDQGGYLCTLYPTDDSVRFFRDNYSGSGTGEDSAGAVARIRVYNTVLSAAEVAALNREPPLLKLSRTSGAAGSSVTVNGYGFSPGENVRLSFVDNPGPTTTSFAPTATGSRGGFQKTVTVPAGASPSGSDFFRARGLSSGLTATKTFDVTG